MRSEFNVGANRPHVQRPDIRGVEVVLGDRRNPSRLEVGRAGEYDVIEVVAGRREPTRKHVLPGRALDEYIDAEVAFLAACRDDLVTADPGLALRSGLAL